MVRRAWDWYAAAATSETDARFGVVAGLVTGVGVPLIAQWMDAGGGATIQAGYYQTAATVIPVLLLAWLLAQRSLVAGTATSVRALEETLRGRGEEGEPHEPRRAELEHLVRKGRLIVDSGRALAANIATIAACGEVAAFYAVGHGTTSTYLYLSSILALLTSGGAFLLFLIKPFGERGAGS